MPRAIPLSFLALALAAASQAAGQAPAAAPEILGFWQDVDDGDAILKIEPNRITLREDEGFKARLARFEEDRVVMNSFGTEVAWEMELEDGVLEIVEPGRRSAKERRFRRVEQEPADFEPKPMALGDGKRLRRSDVKRIQRELLRRERKDQQARGSDDWAKIARLDAENRAWLRDVVSRVGWIDVDRFGVEAATAAWLLTVHSDDLPLMLAALPEIEKDVAARDLPDGQNYANLFDRVRQHLGRKQRYGTQIVQDDKGRFLVYSLEDREKVDEWRKELRMVSLAESLVMHRKWTGAPIGFQEGF